MTIKLIVVGKTRSPFISEGFQLYTKRLRHYVNFDLITCREIKPGGKSNPEQLKTAEGQLLLKQIQHPQQTLLLDARGATYDSLAFARLLQNKMNQGLTSLEFVVGGAYGFSQAVLEHVPNRLSFSAMTMSHELIRLVFIEQLYRAMTINRNEPYHHE